MSDSPLLPSSEQPLVSVIIPVYQNLDTLDEIHRRLNTVFETIAYRLEIIFVDDACPQKSFRVIEQINKRDNRVKAIALAHNIGQQRAIMLGLRYARGQYAIIMDADLQDPPEAIPSLLQKISQGYEAVFAGRRGQYQSQSRLFTSRLFKGLVSLLTGIPSDAGIYVVITKKMRDSLLALSEPKPYVVGMIGCTQLRVTSIPIIRSNRPIGQSTYSAFDRLRIGFEAIARILAMKLRKPQPFTNEWPYEAPVATYLGIPLPALDSE